jgi:methionyl-tRNA synthetase
MTESKRYTITRHYALYEWPSLAIWRGLPSDIYSRYLRLKGRDVLFVCGSDEHGVAISMKAKRSYTTRSNR